MCWLRNRHGVLSACCTLSGMQYTKSDKWIMHMSTCCTLSSMQYTKSDNGLCSTQSLTMDYTDVHLLYTVRHAVHKI
jgi:hypothetical protein